MLTVFASHDQNQTDRFSQISNIIQEVTVALSLPEHTAFRKAVLDNTILGQSNHNDQLELGDLPQSRLLLRVTMRDYGDYGDSSVKSMEVICNRAVLGS